MKRVVSSLIMAGAITASSSAFGLGEICPDFSPYIGVDVQRAWMGGRGDWNTIFPDIYNGYDLYIGAKFNSYWGLEVGWDWTPVFCQDTIVTPNTSLFGFGAVSTAHNIHSEVKRHGAHVDLMGFLPFCQCWELLGGVGVGWSDPRVAVYDVIQTPLTQDVRYQSAFFSAHGASKYFWRLKIGLNYMFTDCLGIRGLIGWEGTRALRVEGNSLFKNLGFDKKAFRNTTSAAVGVFVRF